MDKHFNVVTLAATPNPQQLIYRAMHQDYSPDPVYDIKMPSEERCGHIAVNRLLKGDRHHWGCTEHPQITLNAIGFPHSVMQQARTHRVGVSFDVQSFRYTSQMVLDVAENKREIESVFYFRPVGEYHDRQGKKYIYSDRDRYQDICNSDTAAYTYSERIAAGYAEEHARDLLPFNIRQHFVVSFNLRSALHFLDLRYKADAQLEIQQMSQLLWERAKEWAPEICSWYEQKRLGKAKLAP